MTAADISAGLALSAAFAAGIGLGIAYFRALRHTVRLYASGGGLLVPALLSLLRMAAALLVLAFLARQGAMPLLSAALGFVAARALALRAAKASR